MHNKIDVPKISKQLIIWSGGVLHTYICRIMMNLSITLYFLLGSRPSRTAHPPSSTPICHLHEGMLHSTLVHMTQRLLGQSKDGRKEKCGF